METRFGFVDGGPELPDPFVRLAGIGFVVHVEISPLGPTFGLKIVDPGAVERGSLGAVFFRGIPERRVGNLDVRDVVLRHERRDALIEDISEPNSTAVSWLRKLVQYTRFVQGDGDWSVPKITAFSCSLFSAKYSFTWSFGSNTTLYLLLDWANFLSK